ncbi:UNVERIFIED_CONTAM: hypothetical protein ABIC26_003290 [Paenibacillus sp. PvR008]
MNTLEIAESWAILFHIGGEQAAHMLERIHKVLEQHASLEAVVFEL